MINVLGRPDFHKGDPERGYWPVPRSDPEDPVVGELGVRGVFFHPARVKFWNLTGVSKEEREEEFRKWVKEQGLTVQGISDG